MIKLTKRSVTDIKELNSFLSDINLFDFVNFELSITMDNVSLNLNHKLSCKQCGSNENINLVFMGGFILLSNFIPICGKCLKEMVDDKVQDVSVIKKMIRDNIYMFNNDLIFLPRANFTLSKKINVLHKVTDTDKESILHGHTWKVKIDFSFPVNLNYSSVDLDKSLDSIFKELDYANLNEKLKLSSVTPEIFAFWLWFTLWKKGIYCIQAIEVKHKEGLSVSFTAQNLVDYIALITNSAKEEMKNREQQSSQEEETPDTNKEDEAQKPQDDPQDK